MFTLLKLAKHGGIWSLILALRGREKSLSWSNMVHKASSRTTKTTWTIPVHKEKMALDMHADL